MNMHDGTGMMLAAFAAQLGIATLIGAAFYCWALRRNGYEWSYWPCVGTEVLTYAIGIPPATVLGGALGFANAVGAHNVAWIPATAYMGWIVLCMFFARPLAAMVVSRGAVTFRTAFLANLLLVGICVLFLSLCIGGSVLVMIA